MKATGIVVEYNPFHNGHRYHLQKAKELNPDSIIIAVMSGDFVQRGEPSIVDRWTKAKMALANGIDIVVELPVFYSSQRYTDTHYLTTEKGDNIFDNHFNL